MKAGRHQWLVDPETVRILSLAGVAAILIGVMVYNQLAPAKAVSQVKAEPEGPSLIAKFVHHQGSVVGETIAEDGDHLILKQAGVFKAVPKAQAKPDGGDVRLEGDVDWDEAIAKGMAWHQEKTAGHDPSITQNLTRSEDVRAPALAAFKEREGIVDDSEE